MLVKDYLLNRIGSNYNSKIIIFQSDDWGSIRMPSKKIFEILNNHNAISINNDYCKYDTLASAEDLEYFFEILTSFKDCEGRHPVISANCILANPDFSKIKDNDYQKYYYDDLKTSFQKYNNEKALKLWKEGLDNNIFIPQFHGREHVNVPFWLHCLKNDVPGVRYAFDNEVFGVTFKSLPQNQTNFQRAWDLLTPNSIDYINQSIKEGLDIFEQKFGFQSRTVIAPNYTWTINQEALLKTKGVKYMQGILRQRVPKGYNKPYEYKYRITKKFKNKSIGFLRRNVFFEPSYTKENYRLDIAMQKIAMAFKAKKPAIIGTHRINYVGVHSERNRDQNLILLRELLKSIIKKWPDVIFLASPDIDNERN